ncbi:protealysin inhibitor emfourin [Nocardia sp. NPDC050630]|uniref:protealysin inhibitor emfourin n=1 Tax=Nocardia sp. NPDC050630 TaxID=3364321 RepID=UPI0037B6B3BE
MATSDLHLEFRRSGGLAGIEMTTSVDARDLPAEQAPVITDLLNDTLPERDTPPPRPPIPDQFNYELTVTDGHRTSTYHWTDMQIPDAAQPLIAELAQRSEPEPTSGCDR